LRFVLQSDSLEDVTNLVSPTGQLNFNLPTAENGSYYRLFTYFQKQTLNKALSFTNGSETGTIFENGSYVVDHYSARGAQTTIDFWETYMLTNGVKELLMEAGNYGWEDSIEIISNTSWSPNFPANFEETFGYSLLPYLPLVQWDNNNLGVLGSSDPGPYDCVLDTPDQGIGYVNDFRAIMTAGYREYLQAFKNWTNSMNLQYSSQVSYNLPMDMESNIPFVDAPECESLGFGDSIDGYKQFIGPAQLAGKRVISNEMGANMLEVYQLTISHLLWQIGRAFATGVNQVVIHGQQYTGDYYGTTWPGYVSFSYLFSEMWSNKQPSWDNGFGDALNHVARMQYILQQGTPKTDVAMYNKQAATNPNFPTLYTETDMLDEGWTYTYLSPDNFALPEAQVENGILAPEGPAYKAMVVNSNSTNVTLASIQTLASYAQNGLSIILAGGKPGYFASSNSSEYTAFESSLAALMNTKNVYSVEAGGVASKLDALGLRPNVKVETNGTWYTTFHVDSENGLVYVSIFADLTSSTGTIEVATTGVPYFFNTWTGEQSPVLAYTKSEDSITIPLSLVGNQTVLIAISSKPIPGIDTPGYSITSIPACVAGHTYSSSRGLALHVTASSTAQSVNLSTGQSLSLNTNSVAEPFTLSNWTLIAQHWAAPSNISDAAVIADKFNATLTLPALVSWKDIPSLANVSGVGYYSATFAWPPSANAIADGAYIVFPPVLHALRVRINGRPLPPLDFTAPKADISSYLHQGVTLVEALVPTTMWNYLRSIFGDLEDAGSSPLLVELTGGSLPGLTDNGLVGTVSVVPYEAVVVSEDGFIEE
jgi:hypothetical protein